MQLVEKSRQTELKQKKEQFIRMAGVRPTVQLLGKRDRSKAR